MGKYRQIQTAIASSLGSLLMGLLFVWPSYTLSLYTSRNTTLLSEPLTEIQSSLFGCLPSLGGMAGTAVVGYILGKFGRKKGGLIITLPFIVSWGIIEACSNAVLLLIARFLGGMAGGAFLVYGPIYVSEVAEDSIRGALASGTIVFYGLGMVFSYILGWVATHHIIIWINLALSVVSAIIVMTCIESPTFLVKQNREQEALDAIAKYRGESVDSKLVLEEYRHLKQRILPALELLPIKGEEKADQTEKEQMLAAENGVKYEPKDNNAETSSWKLLFASPTSRRAFIMVSSAAIMQVSMGMVAVQVYAKDLFSKVAPQLSSHFCSTLFAIIYTAGSLTASAVADRAGRKILVITSSVMVALCLAALGIFLQTNVAPPVVSAVMILVYCFSFNFGAGTVPYILLAECFTSKVQSLASTIIVEFVWFMNFVVIGIFPFLTKFVGIAGSFYIFGCFGIANSVINFIFLPETKGLSIEEIQLSFARRRK